MRCRDQGLAGGPRPEPWRQFDARVPVYESRCDITPGRAATKKKNQHNSRMQRPVPEGWVGGRKNRGGRHWAGYDSTGLIVPVDSPPSGDAQTSERWRYRVTASHRPVIGPVAVKETHISFGREMAFFLFVGASSSLLRLSLRSSRSIQFDYLCSKSTI